MKPVAMFTTLAAAAAMAAPALAQAGEYDGRYYGHMYGGYGFVGFGMMIIVWGGIIVLTVLAVRWMTDRNGGGATRSRSDALDILKERLAKGEIEPEEYEARRKVLEN